MENSLPPSVSFADGVFVITLGPEYSHLHENMLDNLALLPMLADSIVPPRMVIDMAPVQFIGSALIGHLVAISQRLSAREEGALGLCNLNKFCKTALSVSNLDSMMQTFDSPEAAVATLGSN
ncbi:MAG: STAS domain-containing protein [Fuerstiella sp.]|nr:STAS domain-containing protein [Fuerstiella sp.]MCP4855228.1 STAS domain-containing protein [Fuerstiella sp.]